MQERDLLQERLQGRLIGLNGVLEIVNLRLGPRRRVRLGLQAGQLGFFHLNTEAQSFSRVQAGVELADQDARRLHRLKRRRRFADPGL